MTSAIEERVVEMKFNNQEFERNVNTSINTIDKLKAALDFRGAAKGMDEISKAADKVDMSNIIQGIEAVKVKFDALQVVGFTVIQEITKAFLGLGKKIWDISFGQMKSGGMARALKIEQANFKMKALLKNMKGIGDEEDKIKAKMDEIGDSIDRAVTGTAYGYDAAANVAAQLMASGMTDASKMYDYLRGIAGAAAMTGRSFEDIGQIFTTISSNGKLMTMQLRQFSTAGLNISAELARQMGKTEQQINEMVTRGEISFEEFAQAMYDAFGESAGKADETYAGVTTNIKAQLSRIGQVFAEPYIQNMIPALQKLKAMLVSLKTALIPVGKRFESFMKVVSGWLSAFFESVDFSRLDNFLRGIENIFWAFALVLNSVREAFIEMFPKKSLDELNAAAISFEKFTEAIFPTKNGLEGIKNIIKALLVPVQFFIKKIQKFKAAIQPVVVALFQLVWTLLSLLGHIGNIIVVMTEGIRQSEGFNTVMAMIGYTVASVIIVVEQFLAVIDALISTFEKSDTGNSFMALLKDISTFITNVIVGVLYLIIALMAKIASIINVENLRKFLNGISGILAFIANGIDFIFASIINGLRVLLQADNILGSLLRLIKKIFGLIIGFFKGESAEDNINAVKEALSGLKDKLREVGTAIQEFMNGFDARNLTFYAFALAIIALIFTFRNLLSNLSDLVFNVSKTVNNIRLFTGSLNQVRKIAAHAKMFMYFAASILLIVGALYELSSLPTDRLIPAAGILGTFALAMLGFSALMVVASKNLHMLPTENGTINAISKFIFNLSASLALLALSLKILADVNMDAKQALISVGTIVSIMVGLSAATAVMHRFSGDNMNKGTLSFIAFALAVNLLVKTLANISKEDLKLTWENIVFLLGTIIAVGAAMHFTGSISMGSAFVILAYAVLLKTILGAFVEIANMPIELLNKGLERLMQTFSLLLPVIVITALANKVAGGVGALANVTSFVLSLSLFAVIVSGVVKSLSKIEDPEKLEKATDTVKSLIGSLTAAFSVILLLMGVITYYTSSKVSLPVNQLELGKLKIQKVGIALRGFAAIFIGLAIGVTMLSWAVLAIAKANVTPKELLKAVITVGALIAIVTKGIAAMLVTTSFTQWAKIGPTLVVVMSTITMFMAIVAAIGMLGTIPTDKVQVIQNVVPWVLGILAGVSIMFLAISRMGAESKHEALGLEGHKGSVVKVVAVVMAIIATVAACALIVKFYSENISQFKGFEDYWPLLAILGTFAVMIIALAVATNLIEVEVKKTRIRPADITRMSYMTAMIVLIYGIVLSTVGALIYLSGKMPNAQAQRVVGLSISIGVILVSLTGIYYLLALAVENFPKKAARFDALIKMGASIAILAAVFIAIGAAIVVMAATLRDIPVTDVLATIGAMMAVIGEFAVIVHFFSEKTYFNFKPKKLLTFVGAIGILSLCFIAIAGALRLAPPTGKLSAIVALTSQLALLGIGVAVISKKCTDISIKNIGAFAVGLAAFTACLIAISYVFTVLSDLSIGQMMSSVLALTVLEIVIAGLTYIMKILSQSATGLSNAGMIAMSASIAAFTIGLIGIANSIKVMADAMEKINVDELEAITVTLMRLLTVMALFMAIGGVAGAFTSGLSAAVIGATAMAFLAMGSALYFAAGAVDKYTDAMIKMRDNGFGITELVDTVADGAVQIANRIPDFAAAVLAIITAIAAAIIGGAPAVAASFAIAVATVITYVMYAFIMLGETFLNGIYLIVSVLAQWVESGKGAETFYNLGFVIGNAVVNGILGAFDGLGLKIRDAITGSRDLKPDGEIIQNITKSIGTETDASKIWTRDSSIKASNNAFVNGANYLRFGIGGLNPLGAAGLSFAYNKLFPDGVHFDNTKNAFWEDDNFKPLIEGAQNILDAEQAVAEYTEKLKNGETTIEDYMDVVNSSIDRMHGGLEKAEENFKKMPLAFRNENSDILQELQTKADTNVIMSGVFTTLADSYENGTIGLEDYKNALLTYYGKFDDLIDHGYYNESLGHFTSLGQAIANDTIPESERAALQKDLDDYCLWMREIEKTYREIGGAEEDLEKVLDPGVFRDNVASRMYIDNIVTPQYSPENVGSNSATPAYRDLLGLPTEAEYTTYGQDSREAYDEGFFTLPSRLSSSGGGGRGAQGMVKLLPSTMDYKAAGKLHGTIYKDSVKESTSDLGDDLLDAVESEETTSAWQQAGNEFFGEAQAALGNLKSFLGLDDIPINFDLTNAFDIESKLAAILPEELRIKIGLDVDTSSDEYLALIAKANTNLGGQALWERAGYNNADEYARAQLGVSGDTYGKKAWDGLFGWMSDDLDSITSSINDNLDDVTSSLGDYTDAAGKAAQETDHLADSITNALDMFSEFNVSLDLTANQVLRNFSSQLLGVTDWSTELSALAGRGIAGPVLEYLADMGPEAYDKVHALYTASDAQLSLFNRMYEQKLSLEKNTANKIRDSFVNNGKVITEGAEEIVAETAAITEEVSQETTAAALNEIQQGVSDAGKIGMQFQFLNGIIIPEGIKMAVTQATPSIAAVFGDMGYQSMEAFKHYMNVEDAITMVEGFQEALKESISGSLNIFDAVSEKEEISAAEMLKRMKENVKNVGKWANDLQSLAARGMDEALLSQLQELGPEAADKVHAFTQMTDAELQVANRTFTASMEMPQYTADRLTKSYAEAGMYATLGFVDGVDPQAAAEVMYALGTVSLDSLKEALDINSPSEKTREAGMYTIAGFCIGMEEHIPDVVLIAQTVANAFSTSLDESMKESLKSNLVITPKMNNAKVIESIDSINSRFDPKKYSFNPTIGVARNSVGTTGFDAHQFTSIMRGFAELNQSIQQNKAEVSSIRKDLVAVQSAIGNMSVTLDGSTVGKVMTPYVNQNLGLAYAKDKRRKL